MILEVFSLIFTILFPQIFFAYFILIFFDGCISYTIQLYLIFVLNNAILFVPFHPLSIQIYFILIIHQYKNKSLSILYQSHGVLNDNYCGAQQSRVHIVVLLLENTLFVFKNINHHI